MKYINYTLIILSVLCGFSCKKYTRSQALVLPEYQQNLNPNATDSTEAYYANLRAYKKSDHAICFGWWGGSSAAQSSDMATRYLALPDSMDIVSLWGGLPNSKEAWKELRYCQKVKGTRFVNVLFGSSVDGLMRKNFPHLCEKGKDIMIAIDSVAKSINDTIVKYKLDGFDLDYEPSYGDGGIFGHGPKNDGGDIYTQRLFKALSKYMGPESGTGKLLIVDGENEKGIIPYIDYLCQQAYDTASYGDLDWRYNKYGFNGALPSKKFVVCENMQKYGGYGRPTEYTYQGEKIGSTLLMAMWNPSTGRKGGFGGYIIGSDFASKYAFPYYYLRKGIQIQNPAIK